jgi:hypothetical protein
MIAERAGRIQGGLILGGLILGAGLAAAGFTPARAQMAVPAPVSADDHAGRLAPVAAQVPGGLLRPLSPGEQLIVVRGFRLRATLFDTITPALHAGFASASVMPECDLGPCGFVVVPVAGGFRYTSVISAPEPELLALARDMERANLSLAIIHPPASRLKRMYVTDGTRTRAVVTPDRHPAGAEQASQPRTAPPADAPPVDPDW